MMEETVEESIVDADLGFDDVEESPWNVAKYQKVMDNNFKVLTNYLYLHSISQKSF